MRDVRDVLLGAARRRLRRVAAWRAEDRTDVTTRRSCVVVAPHPDDETLGLGATICRKRDAGVDVTLVFVTDGERSHVSPALTAGELGAIRRAEAQRAASILGVDSPIRFLGFPDGQVEGHVAGLATALTRILDELSPDEVYAPHIREPHPDHAAVARAARAAVARATVADPSRAIDLIEYGIWMWSRWPWEAAGHRRRALAPVLPASRARLARVSTSGLLERKRAALAAYDSQVTALAGHRGWEPLPEEFLARFFERDELHFPVAPAG